MWSGSPTPRHRGHASLPMGAEGEMWSGSPTPRHRGGGAGCDSSPYRTPYTPAAAFSPQSLPKVRAQARLWPPTVTGYSTR